MRKLIPPDYLFLASVVSVVNLSKPLILINSCQAGDGRCAAYATLSHRTVRSPHHLHFTLSCPDVAPAD